MEGQACRGHGALWVSESALREQAVVGPDANCGEATGQGEVLADTSSPTGSPAREAAP